MGQQPSGPFRLFVGTFGLPFPGNGHVGHLIQKSRRFSFLRPGHPEDRQVSTGEKRLRAFFDPFLAAVSQLHHLYDRLLADPDETADLGGKAHPQLPHRFQEFRRPNPSHLKKGRIPCIGHALFHRLVSLLGTRRHRLISKQLLPDKPFDVGRAFRPSCFRNFYRVEVSTECAYSGGTLQKDIQAGSPGAPARRSRPTCQTGVSGS